MVRKALAPMLKDNMLNNSLMQNVTGHARSSPSIKYCMNTTKELYNVLIQNHSETPDLEKKWKSKKQGLVTQDAFSRKVKDIKKQN